MRLGPFGGASAGRLRLLIALGSLLLMAMATCSNAWADHGTGVGVTDINCNRVIFTYSGFANAERNTVTQIITVKGVRLPTTTFTFNGPTGTDTVRISSPNGSYIIDAHAKWKTNGVKGNFDHHRKLTCGPSYTIEKRQQIAGGEGGFTTAPLTGKTGQTVDYEIIVTNTGSGSLALSPLSDPHCDEGTLSGGPGESRLEPETSTTYTCRHVLGAAGPYTNEATATATPSEGPPITQTSNPVVVNVRPEPAFTIVKLQKIDGRTSNFTTAALVAETGQIVDYEVVVTNTGNVPLSLGALVDAHCDKGTIAGGPGANPLAIGTSTTYTCEHLLNSKDRRASLYTNTAGITATPPPGSGSPLTHTSNTVTVNFKGHGTGEGTTEITCSQVTFTYSGFANAENNTVTQKIRVNGTLVSTTTFTFNGPTGSDTVPITTPPGEYIIDAGVTWHTNGVRGSFDHHVKAACSGTQ